MKAIGYSLLGAVCSGLPLLDPPRHYNTWAGWGIFSCSIAFFIIFLYLAKNYDKYYGEGYEELEEVKTNI